MNISVIIPSRGRPHMLREAVASLHARASGEHRVTYVVGADADDTGTIAMARILQTDGVPVVLHCAERSASLGGLANRMSAMVPADLYCCLCDDVLCVTDRWDAALHTQWLNRPDAVWWWRNKQNALYAIVSERWRAAAGRIFTDYFPFWWDDIWLLQVWKYASGEEHLLADASIHDRAPGTTRMRDLQFWTDFFWSKSGERMNEARRIASALGWPPVQHSVKLDLRPNDAYMGNVAVVEARQGETAPPTPEYLQARSRAAAHMGGVE